MPPLTDICIPLIYVQTFNILLNAKYLKMKKACLLKLEPRLSFRKLVYHQLSIRTSRALKAHGRRQTGM